MNIREISTARLREYENNPRNNDLAVEKVKYSIERFGFLFPIVIDLNYVIVCGHTRVRACRELGIQSVPCIIADELTAAQINLFRLVDNKTSEYSDWDFDKLKNELALVDLTLEKNQLLLERFELTAEVFDIDPEQAEIKIPSLNFIGVDKKSAEKKSPVSTIYSDEVLNEPEVEIPYKNTVSDAVIETSVVSDNGDDHVEQKQSKAVLPFCQFRFDDVAFFISQVELERLNDRYKEYIDSGEILKSSFVSYLIRGVETRD